MTAVLSVEGLTLHYGGVTALDGVSFEVADGERVALIGPNGAGKTSLLDCVSGVLRPSAGRVVWRGRDLAGVRPHRRAALGLARTFQGLGVVDGLDVLGNLLLGAGATRRRCARVAAELGLDPSAPAATLTAGERKRVELGRALATGGGLLLLDEPFAGASPAEVESMVSAIRRAPAAALVVDHDTATVLDLCHRAVALDSGRLVAAAAGGS